MSSCASHVQVSREPFGSTQCGQDVFKFKLTNEQGVCVELINYGAAIVSLCVPDKNGTLDDVVLGFDDMDGYLGTRGRNPYFGALVGRVANRIAKGKFTLDGVEYALAINNGVNHLHGGVNSFSRVVWDWHCSADGRVTFTYYSPHMDEGYPGQCMAHVTYTLGAENELMIDFKAMSSRPTPVNLCNHAYFNLAGHSSGCDALYDHVVQLNADFYTPVDAGLIPTGEIQSVDQTPFDLRSPTRLADVLHRVEGGGFDHNFVVNRSRRPPHDTTLIADHLSHIGKFHHPKSGRVLEVYSDQPGFQFYTGNFLPSDGSLVGKTGQQYSKHGGFCVETQNYPDAVNQPKFPNPVLRPGEIYQRTAVYKFSVV